MNMIDLGFFLLCAALAVFGWVLGARFWSEWYYRLFFAMVVGYVIPWGLTILIHQVGEARLRRRPPLPVCENGCCMWKDYNIVNIEGEDIEYVCECGMKYVKSGQRFLRLIDSGERHPYKVMNSRHQWVDDNLV